MQFTRFQSDFSNPSNNCSCFCLISSVEDTFARFQSESRLSSLTFDEKVKMMCGSSVTDGAEFSELTPIFSQSFGNSSTFPMTDDGTYDDTCFNRDDGHPHKSKY